MSALADLLLHPVRLRVVQALAGRELSAAQLRTRLPDVPQATLYRHLDRLHDGGLLEVVAERPVRGAVERTFRLVASKVSLSGADLAGTTADEHRTYFATFLGTLLGDFDRYLDDEGADLEADGVSYRQVPLWLSDEEVHEVLADLRAVLAARLEQPPGPGRRRRTVTIVTLPDPDG